MKLTIFNCSPKHGKNNTGILLDKFIEGFKIQDSNEAEVYKLNRMDLKDAVRVFESSEAVMIAFPLYCYAMPGGMKQFIEALEPLCGKCKNKKLLFLVQYGFREAIHARPLEKYHVKLSKLLGCEYIGTIIKGGCDGLAAGKTNKSILKGIYDIGLAFSREGKLIQAQLDDYSAPEAEKKQSAFIMKLMLKPINKFYWGSMLKKNGVTTEQSYAKPYEIAEVKQ